MVHNTFVMFENLCDRYGCKAISYKNQTLIYKDEDDCNVVVSGYNADNVWNKARDLMLLARGIN